jgi:hypothetical protein
MLDMLVDECSEAHKPLTSDDDCMVGIEDDQTPRPRKKESHISDSEDEVGQDEIYQTPAALKRPKVPKLSISRDQDSSLSEMSTEDETDEEGGTNEKGGTDEDGDDSDEETMALVKGKGKDAHKVIIKHFQACLTKCSTLGNQQQFVSHDYNQMSNAYAFVGLLPIAMPVSFLES